MSMELTLKNEVNFEKNKEHDIPVCSKYYQETVMPALYVYSSCPFRIL